MPSRSICLFLIMLSSANLNSFCQVVDTTSFRMNSRLTFYSNEKRGEMILHVPQSVSGTSLNISLKINDKELTSWKSIAGSQKLRLQFSIDLVPAQYTVVADIKSSRGKYFRTTAPLTILDFKQNEVKTDRLTGGLIVNQKIFFPFGFYCYSPVYPSLPEEEIINGFNMISPYQKVLPETLKARKAYMDRCAQVGMKVHYNLLSVSGGGGVSSDVDAMPEKDKMNRLTAEIKSFMDHPALLAWYISDEPNGHKVPPRQLEEIYNTVKAIDPWHPVSVVFTAPFLESKKYANALDIVMADPYPVPNSSILQVGDVTAKLRSEFDGKKPVWIVPQAFGGGEWWGREPTNQEVRSMTYQAIINGARGIQYFVRHGPNSFPKSTSTWNECGRMALEIAELTPWLLSDEETLPVRTYTGKIIISSAVHDSQLLIITANEADYPQKFVAYISGSTGKKARVLFENRSLSIYSGSFSDYLPALGSQAYIIDLSPVETPFKPYKGNLIKDPGFEDNSSPGVPASCYAWNEGDKGATFFLDTREHIEGNHSLRLVTPQQNKGTRLRFFPMKIQKGRTYILSVWAKGDPAPEGERNRHYFELGMGEYGNRKFYIDNEWRQFVTSVTIPWDTIPAPRTNVILRMPAKGTAWFDMIQVFEAKDVNRCTNPEIKNNVLFY
jgi:hypothetical protein